MGAELKFADTPLLKVAYEEMGPSSGPPVILLHGWPDDIRTWDAIVPRLVEAGFRTIAPFVRGFGPTTFLRPDTIRSGQLSALGSDVKGKLSLALYASAVALAFLNQWISDGIYLVVVLMWLVPDRRIESTVHVDRV